MFNSLPRYNMIIGHTCGFLHSILSNAAKNDKDIMCNQTRHTIRPI